jgi:hypothetical protein
MIGKTCVGLGFAACLAALQVATAPAASAKELKVLSEKTIIGFGHVESVAYDPKEKVFYTSDFAPSSSRPTRTAKVSLLSCRPTARFSKRDSFGLKARR